MNTDDTKIGMSRGFAASLLSIALILLFTPLLDATPASAVETGAYVLVKAVVDRDQASKTTADGTIQVGNGSYSSDFKAETPDGSRKWTIHKQWAYNLPPAKLAPGQEFTITASGSVSTTEKDGTAGTVFYCGGDITQGENRVYASTDRQPNVTYTFKLKAPDGPRSREKFEINLGGDTSSNDYYYEWNGKAAAAEGQLTARLDCGTLEVLPNQNSEICHIVIGGWCRNTGKRVEVTFPLQIDGFGTQGKTGLVVPIGQGSEDTSNMSGSRGPDGSFGKEYMWTLFVRARGTAPAGTQTIPIVVHQEGCGEVKLELKVRVLPGRSQQVGPRRDGDGLTTGDTGVTPPITEGTSPTGLSARLGCGGTLALLPGQVSQSCTIYIKGWRTNTADQVEVFLPQESKPRGNLGNDLVAFPGGGSVDPANMVGDGNGEYPYSIGFRAMENASGVTTMIEIFVRQTGHQPVRLLLRAAVDNTGGGPTGGGTTGGGTGGTPQITGVATSAKRPLRSGDTLEVTVHGTPGLTARFDLPPFIRDAPMTEFEDGEYIAVYKVKPEDQVRGAHLTIRLVAPDGKVTTMKSSETVTVGTDATK